MNDNENTPRRRVDVGLLITALAMGVIAAIGISGDSWWLVPNLLPWTVAGVIAIIGLGLIISTLPRRR